MVQANVLYMFSDSEHDPATRMAFWHGTLDDNTVELARAAIAGARPAQKNVGIISVECSAAEQGGPSATLHVLNRKGTR